MKKKIVILTSYFCSWNGGVDLINYFLSAISKMDDEKNFQIYVIIPKNNPKSFLKRIFYPFFQILRSIIKFKIQKNFFWKIHKGANDIENYILNYLNTSKIKLKIIYKDFVDEHKIIKKISPDLIMPVVINNQNYVNSVGYVFDFQHEYLPEFFSTGEIEFRRNQIKQTLNSSRILVNSINTKNDIIKFYKNIDKNKINVVPFSPYLDEKILDEIIKNKFSKITSNNYFLISNQFWKHKNHTLAIKAFRDYLEEGGKNDLVITGEYKDHRFPKYINEIKQLISKLNLDKKIILTGNIDKIRQLNYLKNSQALIQPTSFEGGPGGGAVTDAIALNVPIILSDIIINKEIIYDKLFYFKSESQADLKKKLIEYDDKNIVLKESDQINKANYNRIKICSLFFKEFFNKS